jgi:hypothetical protein
VHRVHGAGAVKLLTAKIPQHAPWISRSSKILCVNCDVLRETMVEDS